jgi:hypothetical protein
MGTKSWVALGALCLAVLVGLLSRRPVVVVAVAVIAALVMIYVGVTAVIETRRLRAVNRREEERRATPWSHYSRPDLTSVDQWEVGIERVADDGAVLNRVELTRLSADDMEGRLNAEGRAITRALDYNEARAGM